MRSEADGFISSSWSFTGIHLAKVFVHGKFIANLIYIVDYLKTGSLIHTHTHTLSLSLSLQCVQEARHNF